MDANGSTEPASSGPTDTNTDIVLGTENVGEPGSECVDSLHRKTGSLAAKEEDEEATGTQATQESTQPTESSAYLTASGDSCGKSESADTTGTGNKQGGSPDTWISVEACIPRKFLSMEPDVTVVVGGVEFFHYKSILLSSCEFLDKMLASNMKESKNSRIEFPDKDPKEWLEVYKFLDPTKYVNLDKSMSCMITKSNVDMLHPWFDFLDMKEHLERCDQLLGSQIQSSWRKPPSFDLWLKYKGLPHCLNTRKAIVRLAKLWTHWVDKEKTFADLNKFLLDDQCGDEIWDYFMKHAVKFPPEMLEELDRETVVSSPLFHYFSVMNKLSVPRSAWILTPVSDGLYRGGRYYIPAPDKTDPKSSFFDDSDSDDSSSTPPKKKAPAPAPAPRPAAKKKADSSSEEDSSEEDSSSTPPRKKAPAPAPRPVAKKRHDSSSEEESSDEDSDSSTPPRKPPPKKKAVETSSDEESSDEDSSMPPVKAAAAAPPTRMPPSLKKDDDIEAGLAAKRVSATSGEQTSEGGLQPPCPTLYVPQTDSPNSQHQGLFVQEIETHSLANMSEIQDLFDSDEEEHRGKEEHDA